jgi:hypothetical protein
MDIHARLKHGADVMYDDYVNDKELTAFSALDGEAFYSKADSSYKPDAEALIKRLAQIERETARLLADATTQLSAIP